MSSEPKYRNEEWLRQQYIENDKSTYDIAEECACCKTTIRNWLKKYDIQRRESGSVAERRVPDKRLTDVNWLRRRYVEEKASANDIAEQCDCVRQTVLRWLRRHGIDVRGRGDVERRVPDKRLLDAEWLQEQHREKKKLVTEIAEDCGCGTDTVYKYLDKHDIPLLGRARSRIPDARLADAEWLREKYINEQKSLPDIADECSCDATTVRQWLLRHGLETRKPGYGSLSGEEHPRYKGGEIVYGAGWNDTKRRIVRERDEYTCQDPRCSVTQPEHQDEYGEKLHVHHLRKARDVNDPEERNAPENLITLCRDCHRRWEKMADAGLVPEVKV